MRNWMWLGLVIAGTVGIAPLALRAQSFFDPCGQCHLPLVQCQCVQTRPVVQTHLREEQITTYRDVLQTRYREECVVEHTPVTTYEDRIETVWVPQQVTKKVARTVMVPQARARTVPYQVLERIPQTTTRMVPYQTVHHVTEAVPMFATVPMSPVITHSHIEPAPIMTQSPTYVPTLDRAAANAPQKAPPIAPRESKSNGGWQVIGPRTSSLDRLGGYETNYEQPVPTPLDNEPAVRKTSWRGNIPGAASAWNFHDRTVVR